MEVQLYGISDAGPDQFRYLGVTTRGIEQRLDRHVREALSTSGTHKRHWLRGAIDAGRSVEIVQLDTAPTSADALWLERLWICVFRACRVPLTNADDGGAGLLNPTLATRQKMRVSHLGRKASKETRARMRKKKLYPKTRKSRVITEEFRQRMREVAASRPPMAEDVKRRISASRSGKLHSDTTKKLIASRNRERWANYTPGEREQIQSAVAAGGGFGSRATAQKGAAAMWSKRNGG